MKTYFQGVLRTLLFLDLAVILTGRALYAEELVMHNTVKLGRPRPVLCCRYSVALQSVLCCTNPLAVR